MVAIVIFLVIQYRLVLVIQVMIEFIIILFRDSSFHGYTTVAHLHPILKQLHHWMCA